MSTQDRLPEHSYTLRHTRLAYTDPAIYLWPTAELVHFSDTQKKKKKIKNWLQQPNDKRYARKTCHC